jgi:hypothetical protein
MAQQGSNFKGNVRPPYEMPAHLQARPKNPTYEVEVPLLIRLFAWFCVLRAVLFLSFGFIVGIAPESGTAAYVIAHFDNWSKDASPEAVFYIYTAMYGYIAFRWFRRDWKARWGTMFLTGATSVKTLINLAANYAAGSPTYIPPGTQAVIIGGCLFNLVVCAYLAFYPGMEQAFSESD